MCPNGRFIETLAKFHPQVEEKLALLSAEVRRGAVACFLLALDCLESYALLHAAFPSPESLRQELLALALRLCRAKPAMAAIHRACDRCLKKADDALARGSDPIQALTAEVNILREEQTMATAQIANKATTLIPAGSCVLTLSFSQTVHAALLAIHRLQELRVVVCESRPLCEGITLAEALATASIPTTVCTDAAALRLLAACHAVFIGADAVGPDFVINKVGSLSLALGAHHLGLPCFVLADSAKMLQPDEPWEEGAFGSPSEIYPENRPLEALNPYFEKVPLALVTSVVTELL